MINPTLDDAIHLILKQGSLSEFELIKQLQHPPYSLFNASVFKDELSLFQTHFVVHNALYRLRDKGLASGQFDIDTLTTQFRIILLSDSDSKELTNQARPEVVKLREYYLDWDNFAKTDKDDVCDLLSSFWQCYANFDIKQNQQQLDTALEAMGFDQLPNKKELKLKYKQLSNSFHPDKGGSSEQFSLLQHHYQTVKLFAL